MNEPDPTVKVVSVCAATLLLCVGAGVWSCNETERIRSAGPIVETCIKHPATRPPFANGSGL